MAVTMSGATIDNSVREDLKGKSIDVSSTGGNPLEMAFGFKAPTPSTFGDAMQTIKRSVSGATGAQAGLAGITEAFAGHVTTEIENYKANVQNLIDQLKNENSKVAFQGDAVSGALNDFIIAVQNVAGSYLKKLEDAERTIIASVEKAYIQQDTDIHDNVNTDKQTIEGQSA